MQRNEIRYKLFSLQAQAESGKDIPPLPDGFKESFEQQELFRGFINFGVTWDVDEEDHWRIVALDKSHLEKWNDVLRATVPVLTPDGVVAAEDWDEEEWAKKSPSTS